MDRIAVMDDTLSNKIAAGEVVERPASIVKELVENAIDAGSTSIQITLEEAGLQSIRITDNGRGMSAKDARLAFERHATSKIFQEHDLFRIRTLGFRGEALASIASVSKVTMWTSDGETEGTTVQIEGGRLIAQSEAALRRGTDMIVRQLFYNTPARLKYMKTIQTELSHSIDLVNRLAISYPHIAFHLMHHDHLLLQTAGKGDQRRVLADIYGRAVAQKMIPFRGENADFSVHGWMSLPEITRASKNYITLLVNHRWVKSYTIQQAIIEGLHTYLPIGRYPIAVLNIETDPFLTDVNVHPAKQQIRVSKEGDLLRLVKETIREAIQQYQLIPKAPVQQEIKHAKPVSEQHTIWQQPAQLDEQQKQSSLPQVQRHQKQQWETAEQVQDATQELEVAQELTNQQKVEDQMVEDHSVNEPDEDRPQASFPSLVPVGQVHGTYIIAQNEDGFYMIDQHAAQERIKYEYYLQKLSEIDHDERQLLLMPFIFHYSANEKAMIEEHLEALHEIGIYMEEFGPTSYVVKEYPAWFPAGEETTIIEAIIEQVLATRKVHIPTLREETAIMMSCKRSIKANHHLSMTEMERLLADLAQAENPYTCPHGRPVLIHFSTYEIEKMFKRVM